MDETDILKIQDTKEPCTDESIEPLQVDVITNQYHNSLSVLKKK